MHIAHEYDIPLDGVRRSLQGPHDLSFLFEPLYLIYAPKYEDHSFKHYGLEVMFPFSV